MKSVVALTQEESPELKKHKTIYVAGIEKLWPMRERVDSKIPKEM